MTWSTRLHCHNFATREEDWEDWEPAKAHQRKKQRAEKKLIQSPRYPRDKTLGSTFFKSRMEGRCFNCFSPNHFAHACHRASHCWKCFHFGHMAMECSYNSHGEQAAQHKGDRSHGHPHPIHSQENITRRAPSMTDHRSFAEVVHGERGGKMGMAAARYPGDPRARPAHGYGAVIATGDIRRRRDELINRTAVCWLGGNSHDTEPYHLSDALRT